MIEKFNLFFSWQMVLKRLSSVIFTKPIKNLLPIHNGMDALLFIVKTNQNNGKNFLFYKTQRVRNPPIEMVPPQIRERRAMVKGRNDVVILYVYIIYNFRRGL